MPFIYLDPSADNVESSDPNLNGLTINEALEYILNNSSGGSSTVGGVSANYVFLTASLVGGMGA